MSISSLLTTEAPPSPTVTHTSPHSTRHSNVQLTASSSRPQRRKSSVDIPAPTLAVLDANTKKRKREGELLETTTVFHSLQFINHRLALLQTERYRKSNSEARLWTRPWRREPKKKVTGSTTRNSSTSIRNI